ncbi:hypothetical protein RF11_13585 [Thelohanellus kitauei]|uniref:Uncharacterized protein n=1 Tax=Thelohanellus kitauei TaxID=669202 RepID=A0A0C2N088_THEKT|nr:hypothetical protein RF11_13585 [Thelohanellus kitauei]
MNYHNSQRNKEPTVVAIPAYFETPRRVSQPLKRELLEGTNHKIISPKSSLNGAALEFMNLTRRNCPSAPRRARPTMIKNVSRYKLEAMLYVDHAMIYPQTKNDR